MAGIAMMVGGALVSLNCILFFPKYLHATFTYKMENRIRKQAWELCEFFSHGVLSDWFVSNGLGVVSVS